jgi:hypothetical protein
MDGMSTRAKTPAVVYAALSLCACVSVDGRYSPSCPAFSGSTIEFDGGRFEWDKFTDVVRVDDEGKVIDAFPDYPKRGSYRIDGARIEMTAAGGEKLPPMYRVRFDGRSYLYTEQEYAAWQKDGSRARCALALDDDKDAR